MIKNDLSGSIGLHEFIFNLEAAMPTGIQRIYHLRSNTSDGVPEDDRNTYKTISTLLPLDHLWH